MTGRDFIVGVCVSVIWMCVVTVISVGEPAISVEDGRAAICENMVKLNSALIERLDFEMQKNEFRNCESYRIRLSDASSVRVVIPNDVDKEYLIGIIRTALVDITSRDIVLNAMHAK